MAPNLALRSDSWLDLSAAVRSYASMSSVGVSSSGRAAANLPGGVGSDNNGSVDWLAGRSGGAASNRNEHLLIRMRQNSYRANRSQSTTLSSSQLSTSGLSSSLAEAMIMFDPTAQASLASSSSAQPSTHRLQADATRARCARPKQSAQSRSSPFVRSLSSLLSSTSLSGQFNQLRYTCKHLLRRYHERRCTAVADSCAPLDRRASVPPDAIYSQTGRLNCNDDSHSNAGGRLPAQGARMRLTEDWVAHHHHHHHPSSSSQCGGGGASAASCVQVAQCCGLGRRARPRAGRATPQTADANAKRPNSIQIPSDYLSNRSSNQRITLRSDKDANDNNSSECNCHRSGSHLNHRCRNQSHSIEPYRSNGSSSSSSSISSSSSSSSASSSCCCSGSNSNNNNNQCNHKHHHKFSNAKHKDTIVGDAIVTRKTKTTTTTQNLSYLSRQAARSEQDNGSRASGNNGYYHRRLRYSCELNESDTGKAGEASDANERLVEGCDTASALRELGFDEVDRKRNNDNNDNDNNDNECSSLSSSITLTEALDTRKQSESVKGRSVGEKETETSQQETCLDTSQRQESKQSPKTALSSLSPSSSSTSTSSSSIERRQRPNGVGRRSELASCQKSLRLQPVAIATKLAESDSSKSKRKRRRRTNQATSSPSSSLLSLSDFTFEKEDDSSCVQEALRGEQVARMSSHGRQLKQKRPPSPLGSQVAATTQLVVPTTTLANGQTSVAAVGSGKLFQSDTRQAIHSSKEAAALRNATTDAGQTTKLGAQLAAAAAAAESGELLNEARVLQRAKQVNQTRAGEQPVFVLQPNDGRQLSQSSIAPLGPPIKVSSAEQEYYFEVVEGGVDQVAQFRPAAAASQATGHSRADLQQRMFDPIQLGADFAASEAQNLSFATNEPLDAFDDYAEPADESYCRLDRSQVELVQLIGEGQKGYVFLGKLQSRDGKQMIDVAIKTLKYETEQLIDRLMCEAATMRQLEHPHIIRFIGVCPETPALIAMELASFGELKDYLTTYRHLIRISQLVLFTFQISTALSYLESKQYVHRDVAARNVLVCSHNCVKLADFGLSRNLQVNLSANTFLHPNNARTGHEPNWLMLSQNRNSLLQQQQPSQQQTQQQQQFHYDSNSNGNYVAAPQVRLPVRWLAPESLVFRRFTSASDVWMFAVFCWELFHFAQIRPWAHLRNNQVLLAIESGQRLARPQECPSRLYKLMLQCWSYAPVQRPKFREIKQSLWSIYLNERTKEQILFEQQQQQQQMHLKQRQIALQQAQAAKQQQQQQHHRQRFLSSHLKEPAWHTSTMGSLSEYSTGATTTTTTTTTTANTNNYDKHLSEDAFTTGAISPASFDKPQSSVSPSSPSEPFTVDVIPASRHDQSGRLERANAQMDRFQQRRLNQSHNGRVRLQKQRSQGAIVEPIIRESTSTQWLRRGDTVSPASPSPTVFGDAKPAAKTAGATRVARHMDDADSAIMQRRRNQRAHEWRNRWPSAGESAIDDYALEGDDYGDDGEDDYYDDDNDDHVGRGAASGLLAGELAGRLHLGNANSGNRSSAPRAKALPVEPSYEGLRQTTQVAMLQAAGERAAARRQPPVRAKPPQPSVAANDGADKSVAAPSGKSSLEQRLESVAAMFTGRPRPLKAKLREPQTVATQRPSQVGKPLARKSPSESPVVGQGNDTNEAEQRRQLQLHQRLLGRIRSPTQSERNRNSLSGSSADATNRLSLKRRSMATGSSGDSAASGSAGNNKLGVASVDQSLELLESLMGEQRPSKGKSSAPSRGGQHQHEEPTGNHRLALELGRKQTTTAQLAWRH